MKRLGMVAVLAIFVLSSVGSTNRMTGSVIDLTIGGPTLVLEERYQVTPQLDFTLCSHMVYDQQKLIRADTACALGAHGSGQVILIVDTGADPPLDLSPNIRGGYSGKRAAHSNYSEQGGCSGHGTAVASIAVSQEVGIADSAKAFIYNSSDSTLGICGGPSYNTEAGQMIHDSSWRVANFSNSSYWGGLLHIEDTLADGKVGSLLCYAAGNGGASAGNDLTDVNTNPFYMPATQQSYPVIAEAFSPSDTTKMDYSNYGVTMAWGAVGNVTADYASTGCAFGTCISGVAGTSFSAPGCAGYFALLFGTRPTMSAREAILITVATSQKVHGQRVPWDTVYGFGLLRADRAVCTQICTKPTITSNAVTTAAGSRLAYKVTRASGKAWTAWSLDTAYVATVDLVHDSLIIVSSAGAVSTHHGTVKIGTIQP